MALPVDLIVNKLTVYDGRKKPMVCTFNNVVINKGGQLQLLGDVKFICRTFEINDNSLPAVILGTDNSSINIDFELLKGQFLIDLSGNPNGKVLILYKTLDSGASIDAVPKYSVQQYT